LRLGDRDRATTPQLTIKPLALEQRMRPTTRRTLDGSMRRRLPVTRDLRRRQLPTVPSHAVPTRECQSDPPSLLRTHRCSRPRGQPLDRASPLDVLPHVRTSNSMTLVAGVRWAARGKDADSRRYPRSCLSALLRWAVAGLVAG